MPTGMRFARRLAQLDPACPRTRARDHLKRGGSVDAGGRLAPVTGRIGLDRLALELHRLQIEEQGVADRRRSLAEQEMHRLRGQQRADHARDRADARVRRLAPGSPVGQLLVERVVAPRRDLEALEAGRSARQHQWPDPQPGWELTGADPGHAPLEAGLVDPARELVRRPVGGGDQQVGLEIQNVVQVGGVTDAAVDQGQLEAGVVRAQGRGRGLDLELADPVLGEEQLAIQIAELDPVVVDQDQLPDTRAAQATGHPRAEATATE